jgi:hypothetical protein
VFGLRDGSGAETTDARPPARCLFCNSTCKAGSIKPDGCSIISCVKAGLTVLTKWDEKTALVKKSTGGVDHLTLEGQEDLDILPVTLDKQLGVIKEAAVPGQMDPVDRQPGVWRQQLFFIDRLYRRPKKMAEKRRMVGMPISECLRRTRAPCEMINSRVPVCPVLQAVKFADRTGGFFSCMHSRVPSIFVSMNVIMESNGSKPGTIRPLTRKWHILCVTHY